MPLNKETNTKSLYVGVNIQYMIAEPTCSSQASLGSSNRFLATWNPIRLEIIYIYIYYHHVTKKKIGFKNIITLWILAVHIIGEWVSIALSLVVNDI